MAEYKLLSTGMHKQYIVENNLSTRLLRYAKEVRTVSSRFSMGSSTNRAIRNKLSKQADAIMEERNQLVQMSKSLETIRNLYEKTEKRILAGDVAAESEASLISYGGSGNIFGEFVNGIIVWVVEKITGSEIEAIVFDENGEYGGDQGSLYDEANSFWARIFSRYNEWYALVRSYFPDEELTDKQVRNYLKKLSTEGCSYVALRNTILLYYTGKEEEFEQTFGFPMYDDDGSLNHDRLLLDLYATMDNVSPTTGEFDEYLDYDSETDGDIDEYVIWNDTTGRGVTSSEIKYNLETYMEQHGIKAEVTTGIDATADNYQQMTEQGKSVIVLAKGVNLYNMNGTKNQ
ncbi:MAG: hypothetical protein LIO86_03180 [Lachnospiraceae bacterium]|nr:hypothetical protein [Lachnospiraceae bacterium]